MKLIGKAPRGALFTVIVLALGCLIAACGSASGSSTTSSTSTTASAAAGGGAAGGAAGGANPARRAALVSCLKQHGVTLPSRPGGAGGGPPGAPPAGGTGTGTTGTGTTGTGTTRRRGFFGGGGAFANNPKLRAAFQACGANFGAGGRGFRGRLSHANITKYVTCVRQHGYNLPSPNFSGNGPIFPANIQSNAKFQAASRACQSLLIPPRPSGSGTGTSTTSGA